MLGDWDAALADLAEIERLVSEDPRELPVGYSRSVFGIAALLHELRGNMAEAEGYLQLMERFRAESKQSGLRGRPAAAQAALHGGDINRAERFLEGEAADVRDVFLEARCEIALARRDRGSAAEVVAEAYAHAEFSGSRILPLYAARLESAAASWAGQGEIAAAFLLRSIDGFAEPGVAWEEAYSRLLLAEIATAADRSEAEAQAQRSLAVFTELGSVAEIERAERLLAELAS